VHRIFHDGPYYKLDGQHLSEPSLQRTPVLYQAGTSSRGFSLTGRHAECVFLNGPNKAAELDPHDILTFLGATLIVAPTAAEAQDQKDEYRGYLDTAGQLALVSGWTKIDLAALALDDPFHSSKRTPSIRR